MRVFGETVDRLVTRMRWCRWQPVQVQSEVVPVVGPDPHIIVASGRRTR